MNEPQSPDGPASAPAATPEPLAAILAEMRDEAKPFRVGGDLCSNVVLPATISIWADRIEEAARYQFGKILSFCQAEINSALSDHRSSIFMLKVVRDVAQGQLSSLSPTEGKEPANE